MHDDQDNKPDDRGKRVSLTDMVGAGLDAMLGDADAVLAGKRLGPYRIERLLGRGGMGAVYLARRDDDRYQQQVAIKVVTDIAMSPDVQARFRSERQILARLDHPYIAHLIDGGETESGLPYLVMEYVAGEPIMAACRNQNLSVEQRLDLFLKICEAVQFAHQNLVVHRDLKPGNILVTSDGFPKLLDFGIAKILDPLQFEETMIETRDGQRLMTPEHAAPEQVLGKAVTTATDVYCLGILLFEILTGSKPYRLANARPGELERIICEQPTPAPSTSARTTAVDVAADFLPLRPEKLARRLKGDLDNIVLKALRKEPERRYVSANEFAEDIRRHLRGLPVNARPDTFAYRSGKFVRRHVWGVAASATLVSLLAVFAVTTSFQAQRIERERQTAVQVATFLTDLFRSSDPRQARGNEIKAVTLLDQASRRIENELTDQPEIQATLMSTMGVVYTHLGEYATAEPLLTEALARREEMRTDPLTLMRSRNDLGDVLIELGRYEEASTVFGAALDDAGDRHLRSGELGRALAGRGMARMELRDYDTAERLLRRALEVDRRRLTADDVDLSTSLTGYATISWRRNDLDAAERLYREALALRQRAYGDDHPDTVEGMNNLAGVLIDKGDPAGAEPLFRQALAMNEHVLGGEHPVVAINLNNLGYVLLATGRLDEAEPLYRRALDIERAELGADHPDLSYSLNSLAETLSGLGDFDEAELLYRQALDVMAKQTEFEHRLKGQVLANYAVLLNRVGRHDEAHARAVEAKRKIDAEYPADHWRRSFADSVLGASLAAIGRLDEGRELLEQSVGPIAASMGEDSRFAREARQRLALLRGDPAAE